MVIAPFRRGRWQIGAKSGAHFRGLPHYAACRFRCLKLRAKRLPLRASFRLNISQSSHSIVKPRFPDNDGRACQLQRHKVLNFF